MKKSKSPQQNQTPAPQQNATNWQPEAPKTAENLKPEWLEIAAHPAFRIAFFVLIALLAVVMPLLSFHYGVSGDENVHRVYGEKVLDFFLSFGADKSYCDEKVFKVNNLYLYGVSVDLLVAIINRIGGFASVYETRHFVNALSGVFMIMGAGKLAKEIGGWRTAFICAVLMVCSPMMFGHSMNNLKDIPFTAGYLWTLVYIIRLIKELPSPTRRTLILLACAMGFTLSIRVGGLLVFPYLALFVGAAYLFLPHLRADLFSTSMWKNVRNLAFVVLGGYILGIITWPYALESPFKNPLLALSEMEKFSTSIRILFEGNLIWSNNVPWYYIPKWFAISAPLFVFVGLGVAAAMWFFQYKKPYINLFLMILGFAIVFPVAYAIYKNSALYDGMRHFLFVYPLFVVLTAWGFDSLVDFVKVTYVKYAAVGVLAVLCALPLSWMVKNHPYQYIYFNEAFGGIDAAYANYETDYWMNSIRPMSKWFIETHKKDLESGKKIIIGTDCIDQVNYEICRHYPNVKASYMRYHNRSDKPWDYAFFVTRYIDPGFLQNKWYPGEKAIKVAMADNTPIGAVLERKEGYDLQAMEAMKTQNAALADSLYRMEIQKYPHSEGARFNLATLYEQTNQPEKSKEQLDAILAAAPNYGNALSQLATYYLRKNDGNKAEELLQRIVQDNDRDLNAMYFLAMIYMQKNDLEAAQRYIEPVVANAPDFQAAVNLQQEIYKRAQGGRR
jgi:thioredoxin-like negative regulator of GroEL